MTTCLHEILDCNEEGGRLCGLACCDGHWPGCSLMQSVQLNDGCFARDSKLLPPHLRSLVGKLSRNKLPLLGRFATPAMGCNAVVSGRGYTRLPEGRPSKMLLSDFAAALWPDPSCVVTDAILAGNTLGVQGLAGCGSWLLGRLLLHALFIHTSAYLRVEERKDESDTTLTSWYYVDAGGLGVNDEGHCEHMSLTDRATGRANAAFVAVNELKLIAQRSHDHPATSSHDVPEAIAVPRTQPAIGADVRSCETSKLRALSEVERGKVCAVAVALSASKAKNRARLAFKLSALHFLTAAGAEDAVIQRLAEMNAQHDHMIKTIYSSGDKPDAQHPDEAELHKSWCWKQSQKNQDLLVFAMARQEVSFAQPLHDVESSGHCSSPWAAAQELHCC